MNALDTLSSEFHQQMVVPPGPGVETIVRHGAKRRRRRASRNLVVAGALIAGLAGAALNLGQGATNEIIAAGESASSGSIVDRLSIDLDTAMSVLPARAAESVLVPSPTLPGWTVTVDAVDIQGSGSFRSAPTATFLLDNGFDEATIDVARWELPLDSTTGELITIERHGQTVQASRTEDGANDDLVKLRWQEPGTRDNPLTVTVWAQSEVVEDVASTVTFDEQPVSGATTPPLIDTGPNAVVVLAGSTGGVPWRVLDYGRVSELAVELNGQAPQILIEGSSEPNDLPVDLVSISNDGVQINLIYLPTDATATIESSGTIVALPSFELDGSVQQIAVAPIPATVQADRIVIRGPNNAVVVIPLVTPPPTGWFNTRFEAN